MNIMEEKTYKIIVTWWYEEDKRNAYTTIYCPESLVNTVLDHYNRFEVKAIEIYETKTTPLYNEWGMNMNGKNDEPQKLNK